MKIHKSPILWTFFSEASSSTKVPDEGREWRPRYVPQDRIDSHEFSVQKCSKNISFITASMTPMTCWMDSGFNDVLMSYKSSVVSAFFCEDLREKTLAFPWTNHNWKLQSAKRWLSLYEVKKHLPRVYNTRISNFFIFMKSYWFDWSQQIHLDTFCGKLTSHPLDNGFVATWSQNIAIWFQNRLLHIAVSQKSPAKTDTLWIDSNFIWKYSSKFVQLSQPSEEKSPMSKHHHFDANRIECVPYCYIHTFQSEPRWFQEWIFD